MSTTEAKNFFSFDKICSDNRDLDLKPADYLDLITYNPKLQSHNLLLGFKWQSASQFPPLKG